MSYLKNWEWIACQRMWLKISRLLCQAWFLDILVQPGQAIKKGEAMLVLEAMKMENSIKAPNDGTVKSVEAEKGQAVEKNQVLITFE